METYIINGHEIEYDTFDLEAMALFDSESRRVAEEARKVNPKSMDAANYLSIVREQCENILDFFDAVVGDGTSSQIFGGKMNAKDILAAYKKFCADVAETRSSLGKEISPMNRERRGAAERARRRDEA